MGPCNSRKQATNSEQQPYFQELINKIFTSCDNLNKNVSYQELIKPNIKQLIEFLESNQVRIVETIKEIIKRIKESNNVNILNTGLFLLSAIIESLNKFIEGQQKTEPEPEDEDILVSSNELTKQNIMNNEQIVQKLMFIHSELLQAISIYSDDKLNFMQFTYTNYMNVLSQFSKKLLVINQNKKTLSIVIFLQELIYKFFLPLIYERGQIMEMKKKNQFQKRNTIARNIFKQESERNEQIEKIAENMNEEILFDSFDVYIRFLRQVELQFDDISKLFINQNQKVLLQALIWLYTIDSIQLDDNSGYTKMTLTLLELYYQKAKFIKHLDEYYQTIFLDFNEKLWSQQQKVLFIYKNSGNQNFSNFLIQYLQTKHFPLDINQSQSINQIQIKRFSYYLENQKQYYQQDIDTSSQQKNNSSINKQNELIILKTVVSCLYVFLQDCEDLAFFDWEKNISLLIQHLAVAEQFEFKELQVEIKQIITFIMQKVEFLNALQILIIYITEQGNTCTVLDLISENLHLMDQNSQIENNVIVKLLSLGQTFEQKMKVLSIITRIITQIDVDLNKSCSIIKKNEENLLISDQCICYYLVKYSEIGLTSVFHIFIFIQILRELIVHKEDIVLSIGLNIWDKNLKAKNIIVLSIELLIWDKYKKSSQYDWINNINELNKGQINHLLNFETKKQFGDIDWLREYCKNKVVYNLDEISKQLQGKQDFVEQLVDLEQIQIRETQEKDKGLVSQSISQFQSFRSGRIMTEDSYFERLMKNQHYNMLKESNSNSINDY